MKKRYIVNGIMICIVILLVYLQNGRKEKVMNTVINQYDKGYEEEICIIANKLYIREKEKYAEELIDKVVQNKYQNVRFSYDILGYPEKIKITVYYSEWDYRNIRRSFTVLYSSEKEGERLNIKDDAEKYKVQIVEE